MDEKANKREDGINRRQFLKNSAYAAYATPIVLTMLVDKASAAKSWNPGYNCGDKEHGDRRMTRRERRAIRRLRRANRRERRAERRERRGDRDEA